MTEKKEHIAHLLETYIPETAGKLVETPLGVMYASKDICFTIAFDNMNGMKASITSVARTFYATYVTNADKVSMRKTVKWLEYMAS